MAPFLNLIATYPGYTFAGILLLVAGLAWWKGGAPERIVGALFGAAFLASVATDSPRVERYFHLETVTALIDLALLIALFVVARAANRRWTTVAASLQLLIVIAHAARAINVHQAAFIYMLMTAFWPILQMLVLLIGTILHWCRVSRHGAEPSWKSFSG